MSPPSDASYPPPILSSSDSSCGIWGKAPAEISPVGQFWLGVDGIVRWIMGWALVQVKCDVGWILVGLRVGQIMGWAKRGVDWAKVGVWSTYFSVLSAVKARLGSTWIESSDWAGRVLNGLFGSVDWAVVRICTAPMSVGSL
ncbi:hypothetical protein Salat_2384200 [Sesamum alatum]|uniref:Uncharacterized protein n=1 Tax=Sesamum alatum TaxID=300844 RepID=A0AAE1XY96_9LAMI|nr:hypothetical protein Salat_2384200 [Sesamum alatum]